MSQPFTLLPGCWYAAELIGDEFEGLRSYTPIRVDRIEALGTGHGEMRLEFFHANYPQGVQQKSYRLRVVERGTRFLLARCLDHSPARLLLIYDPTWDWLKEHFGLTNEEPTVDLQAFMERRCR